MRPLFPTRDRPTAELARTLARLAATDLTVLLEGETGTGKNYVATRLHRRGRPATPLVVFDCGAVPPALLASELFGHRAGAFTDATRARSGALERAASGTFVLDRIDALPPESQVLLLRALEERSFQPVGSSTVRPFHARVVALAGVGLTDRIADGTFRPDLYHRLAGFHAELPPLRCRPKDIPPFAALVLVRQARLLGRRLELGREAEELMLGYPWPGNFRELATRLERASLVATGELIGATDLDLPVADWVTVAPTLPGGTVPLREASRLYALAVLAREGGNASRAARALGISRRTLIRWRGGR